MSGGGGDASSFNLDLESYEDSGMMEFDGVSLQDLAGGGEGGGEEEGYYEDYSEEEEDEIVTAPIPRPNRKAPKVDQNMDNHQNQQHQYGRQDTANLLSPPSPHRSSSNHQYHHQPQEENQYQPQLTPEQYQQLEQENGQMTGLDVMMNSLNVGGSYYSDDEDESYPSPQHPQDQQLQDHHLSINPNQFQDLIPQQSPLHPSEQQYPLQQQQQQQQQPQQQLEESPLPKGWLSFVSDDGYRYFFNVITKQTQWTPPTE